MGNEGFGAWGVKRTGRLTPIVKGRQAICMGLDILTLTRNDGEPNCEGQAWPDEQ